MDNNCKNCSSIIHGKICDNCGQKVIDERWSTKVLWTQFFHQITNIEKGFFFTIKALFILPGKLIGDYWRGSTVKYYNPFRYVLILIAVNLLLSYWLGINDMLEESLQSTMVADEIEHDQIQKASQKFDNWLNFLVLLLIPVRSGITRFLFKNSKNNFAEHLIMNSYIVGQQSFISSFTQFIFYFSPSLFVIYMPFNFIVGVSYDTFVFRKTFNEHVLLSLVKALVTGILGIIAFLSLVYIFSFIAISVSG